MNLANPYNLIFPRLEDEMVSLNNIALSCNLYIELLSVQKIRIIFTQNSDHLNS